MPGSPEAQQFEQGVCGIDQVPFTIDFLQTLAHQSRDGFTGGAAARQRRQLTGG
ncbi:hypothetical protein H8F24_03000 [Synechococcus sp. CBW1002]|jgi:hypothetical protein|uniref:hypothetical protein n=1 Tax=Synechococcus sp. CBW1002 TaxID=1353134 RepID=UPI0018CE4A23|nr:hypothetical protein [Synechococcus sp. CBW1002]QPN60427.1 hypothetical protein H8F24_03000 [Synechococcus sp. CBW1002]